MLLGISRIYWGRSLPGCIWNCRGWRHRDWSLGWSWVRTAVVVCKWCVVSITLGGVRWRGGRSIRECLRLHGNLQSRLGALCPWCRWSFSPPARGAEASLISLRKKSALRCCYSGKCCTVRFAWSWWCFFHFARTSLIFYQSISPFLSSCKVSYRRHRSILVNLTLRWIKGCNNSKEADWIIKCLYHHLVIVNFYSILSMILTSPIHPFYKQIPLNLCQRGMSFSSYWLWEICIDWI